MRILIVEVDLDGEPSVEKMEKENHAIQIVKNREHMNTLRFNIFINKK